jgi:hypothetical protein
MCLRMGAIPAAGEPKHEQQKSRTSKASDNSNWDILLRLSQTTLC